MSISPPIPPEKGRDGLYQALDGIRIARIRRATRALNPDVPYADSIEFARMLEQVILVNTLAASDKAVLFRCRWFTILRPHFLESIEAAAIKLASRAPQ